MDWSRSILEYLYNISWSKYIVDWSWSILEDLYNIYWSKYTVDWSWSLLEYLYNIYLRKYTVDWIGLRNKQLITKRRMNELMSSTPPPPFFETSVCSKGRSPYTYFPCLERWAYFPCLEGGLKHTFLVWKGGLRKTASELGAKRMDPIS